MIFTKKNFLIFFYVLLIGTSRYKFSFLANFLQIVENFLEINDACAVAHDACAELSMRSQVMRMHSFSNNVMRMRILLKLRMRTTWLRIRIY